MADHHNNHPPRRTSSAIPPPPPLPPPSKPPSYFSRLVNLSSNAYGSRPTTAQIHHGPDGGRPNPLVPKIGVRLGSSQDASHKTGLDISALDVNRDRTHAVLAGKEILKTVRVQDARIVEETNLRAAVLNYAHQPHARQREGPVIQDVKWSHGQFRTHIATAAANGKVILYDLNRAGIELARLHEHSRQVHKLAFNPHQGHLLLSASHDTNVRLWDLRDMRKDALTCHSRDMYAGMNGAIYDVQWSPTDAVEFAFGTDNGTIQRWDFRYHKAAKQKLTAHDQRTCTSIDWHPDGKHLLSAGVDRTVKVWDFSVDGRRQKPAFVLTTPYPVYGARWRPPYWSSEHYERGAYQCTQLATSYDHDHPVIHIWDFRRPHMPSREINKFSTAPSDMLWHTRDTLWTVGREGVFQQNDVHHAPRIVDRRNWQALAVSPSGDLCAVAQARPRRRHSTGLSYAENAYMTDARDKRNEQDKASLRSSVEDNLDDNYLTSSFDRYHGRSAGNRSAKSMSTTPPSDAVIKVIFLSDSMTSSTNAPQKPSQLAFHGPLPGAANAQIFAYLAQKYKAIPLADPPTVQAFKEVQTVFEQNAEYAQRAALHRLAATWRLIGSSVSVATRRRAEMHRARRLESHKPAALVRLESQPTLPLAAVARQRSLLDAVVKPHGLRKNLAAAFDATGSRTPESTSNLATPLARPLTTSALASRDHEKTPLPDPDQDEKIELPPALSAKHSRSTNYLAPPGTAHVPTDQRPDFQAPQWQQSAEELDQRRAMGGSWRAPARVPLSLDVTDAQGVQIGTRPRMDRHDSDESFAMFSASTDSQGRGSMPSSFASDASPTRRLESMADEWQMAPERSSFGNARSGAGTNEPRHNDDLGVAVSSPTSHAAIKPAVTSTLEDPPTQLSRHSISNGTNSTERAFEDMEILRRHNQLFRHDSSESESFANSFGDVSETSITEHTPDLEASGTIVPDGLEVDVAPQGGNPTAFQPVATEHAAAAIDPAAEEGLLLADFEAMHADADAVSAFSIVDLIQHTIDFYAGSQSDAQTASLLLLLVTPLLPRNSDRQSWDFDDSEMSRAFAEVLAALGLSPTQVSAIVAVQLSQVVETGINPYQAEAILHTYHSQLHSLSLFNAAASLRRIAYPTYPGVYEQALKETQVGLLCLSCKSPINNPKDKTRCETCKRTQAPCPICWGRYPAFEPVTARKKAKAQLRATLRKKDHRRKRSSVLSSSAIEHPVTQGDDASVSIPTLPSLPTPILWTWCPLCGHGGHTNCISTWFVDAATSGGACPTEGCFCDCVQGKRRDDRIAQVLLNKAEKERARVVRKGDDWKVRESRAVSAVRSAISSAPSSATDTSTMPGSAARKDRDDARRVRLVEPAVDPSQ